MIGELLLTIKQILNFMGTQMGGRYHLGKCNMMVKT
jgi:hypothetical protein